LQFGTAAALTTATEEAGAVEAQILAIFR